MSKKLLSVFLTTLMLFNTLPVNTWRVVAEDIPQETPVSEPDEGASAEEESTEGVFQTEAPSEEGKGETVIEIEVPADTKETAPGGSPGVSEAPVITEAPAETEIPAETEVPEETAAPTEVPAETEAPAETETPEATAAPAASEEPAAETPVETEVPAETSDPEDDPEIQEAPVLDFVMNEEIQAFHLHGSLALDQDAAIAALTEETELSKEEAEELTGLLFAEAEEEEEEEEGEIPRSADGSNIESISAKWVTADTTDNGEDGLLYIKPNGDELQNVRLQISYALSGEHNYAPGDITITIPASIFTTREGKNTGKIVIPYPEDPSRKNDFNWKLVGDHYILTNTKNMSAATKGYIEIGFGDMKPHELVDMQVSKPFDAYLEVVTHKGNTIALRSNELTAQFDTEAKVTSALKRAHSAARYVSPSQIPAAQRTEGEEEYVWVDWYVQADIVSNTQYVLKMTDTIPDEYHGFIVDKNAGTLSEEDRKAEKTLTPSYSDGWTNYYSFSTAYPASQFKKDTSYYLKNNIEFTLTEVDPAAEVTNPNVGEDPQLITTAVSSAQTLFRYTDPKWENPQGHFMVIKNGNDDTRKRNLTHNQYYPGGISDIHMWYYRGSGYYGIYPSALNQMQNGEDVRLSYTVDTVGYIMPWTYKEVVPGTPDPDDPTKWEIPPARIKENFFNRSVTLTTSDKGISLTRYGEKLKIFEDYEYVSIEFPQAPWIYDGEPHNINDDGSWSAKHAQDGTFLYTRDSDCSHIPDITLEILRNGKWEKYATASWKSGSLSVKLESGETQTSTVVEVPSDTENFRTIVVSNNAAIDYDIRPVIKLKDTERMQELIAEAFEATKIPEMEVWNEANMTAVQTDDDSLIVSIDNDGRDLVRGYTTDVEVYPFKNGTSSITDVDYDRNLVTIHYNARVEERSLIDFSNRDIYVQALEDKQILPETHGTWRDLLPKGVTPDLNSIRLRSGDRITSVSKEDNYNGSGRTLLIVEADLTPVPQTYRLGDSYYYEDVPSISFDATYPLEALTDYGNTLHNVISFESSNEKIGNVDGYKGEPDDPFSSNNVATARAFADEREKGWMKDLDPDRDDPVFVYAGVYTHLNPISAARTSLQKDVMVNNDGIWGDGLYYEDPEGNRMDVYEGGRYTYRLRMVSNADTISKDMVLYDSLENFYAGDGNDEADIDAPRWQGRLFSIDVSQLIERGCAPVIYYSTVPGLELSDESDPQKANTVNTDLTNKEVWIRADDYQGELKDVKAVAIDASKKKDGSDFELQPKESVVVFLEMRAPSAEEAAALEEDAHAYNNGYLIATSVDSETGVEEGDSFIRKDYTKVGLKEYQYHVSKLWDDDKDRDGKRPEEIVIHLLANGEETGKTLTIIPDEDGKWEAHFEHLPYFDENGKVIRYSVREEVPESYTAAYKAGEEGTTITNSRPPEKTEVSGQKIWVGDNSEARPESIIVKLYKNGEYLKQQTVKVDKDGNWKYSFNDLFKYEKGEEISYTVEEVLSGKGDSYQPAIDEDGRTLINTYHPLGDLIVRKQIRNTTEVSAEQEFRFTFRFTKTEDGEEKPVLDSYEYYLLNAENEPAEDAEPDGTVANGETVTIKGGQAIYIKDIDEYVNYTVSEEETAGFSQTNIENASGTIRPNTTASASFTNTYAASGRINLQAEKTLLNRELQRYQFRFELYEVTEDEEGNESETLIRTASNERPSETVKREDETVESSTAAVIFGALRYTEADHGKTYNYRIKETKTDKAGYVYDESVYDVTVEVTDNGDGTLTITPVYSRQTEEGSEESEKAVFSNEYKAEGELTLRAWKDLQGRKVKENEFSFQLLDEHGAVLQTKGNDEKGAVSFDALKFTEKDIDKTFIYGVKEITGSDATVIYSKDIYGYTVTVRDNGDGTLSFEQGFAEPEYGPMESCPKCNGEGNFTVELGNYSSLADEYGTFGEKMSSLMQAVSTYGAVISTADAMVGSCSSDFTEVLNAFNDVLECTGHTERGLDGKDLIVQYSRNGDIVLICSCPICNGGNGICFTCSGTGKLHPELTEGIANPFAPAPSGSVFITSSNCNSYSDFLKANPNAKTVQIFARICELGGEITIGNEHDRQWYIDHYMHWRNQYDATGLPYSVDERVPHAEYHGSDPVLAELFGIPEDAVATFSVDMISAGGYAHGNGACSYVIKASCDYPVDCPACSGTGHMQYIVHWNTEEGELPVFTNTLKPGNLSITKYTQDAETADPNQEFTFHVKLIGEGIPDGELEYQLEQVPAKDTAGNGTSATPLQVFEVPEEDSAVPEEQPVNEEIIPEEGTNTSRHFDLLSSLFMTVKAEDEDIVRSGTYDGVSWRLTKNHELIIGKAGEEQSFTVKEKRLGTYPWLKDDWYKPSYIWTVRFEGTVRGNGSMDYMFVNCTDLRNFDSTNFDTKNITSMKGMFAACKNLRETDFSHFDTSSVTDMSSMFSGCQYTTKLDLSSFDTSKVTDMSYMFYTCQLLTNLNLSSFDTSNVTDMSYMFCMNSTGQYSRTLDVSGFNTQNVANMCSMFSYLSVDSLDVTNFDTRNVTNMSSMFMQCKSLKEVDVSGFDTGNVTDFSSMFGGCRYLKAVDVSGFDTSKATNMSNMFSGCNTLTELDFSSFDTRNVTRMGSMFNDCRSLTSLDLSGFNTEKVTDMSQMFLYCTSLEDLDVSSFDTGNVQYMSSMFSNCGKLRMLDLSGFDTRNVTYMGRMFDKTDSLAAITLSENFSFKGKDISSESNQAVLMNPTATEELTGKWIRDDGSYGPYTAEELKERYQENADTWSGTWIWQTTSQDYSVAFTAPEATGAMPDSKFNALKEEQLPANRFYKFAYTFDHWDDGNGHTYADQGAIPANTYSAGSSITLTAVFTPINTTVNVVDGAFTFTLKGNERAVFSDIPAGTAYQVYEETPDGWVLIEQKDVSGTIQPLETSEAEFTNKYQPGTTTAQFNGTKTLDGQAAEKDSYSFTLTEAGAESLTILENGEEKEVSLPLTVSVSEGGFLQFPIILYTEEGVHTYTIAEVDPQDEKVDYDTHKETVTVTVSDDGHGNLSASVSYDTGDIAFANKTRPGNLRIRKIAENVSSANKDDTFTFKITLNNEKGIPLGEDDNIYWYVLNADGSISNSASKANKLQSINGLYKEEPLNTEDLSSGGNAEYKIAPVIGSVQFLGNTYVSKELFHASDEELEGDAYAILTADGELIFFRSKAQLTAGTGKTVTINGESISGQIFCVDEEGTKSGSTSKYSGTEWQWPQAKIKSVRVADGYAIKPASMASWFANCSEMTAFDANGFDTSNVRSMYRTFYYCYKLSSLDLAPFDTKNVTTMEEMLANCYKITYIGSRPDKTYGLRTVNVSGFDTGNVTNMCRMFSTSALISSLDVSRWDTSKVTTMESMFERLTNISRITGLSNWDTGQATNMKNMFFLCHARVLDVSNWNTGNVVTMESMFKQSRVQTLDISGWDTHSLQNVKEMFCENTSLRKLDAGNWDTSKVTSSVNGIFRGCSSLTALNISGWDLASASYSTSGYSMFANCSNLSEISIGEGFRFFSPNNLFPTPKTSVSTGNWIRIDDALTPKTEEELNRDFSNDPERWAGTWIWEIDNSKCFITFDANGGYHSGEGTLAVASADQPISLPSSETTTRLHYSLSGWSTTKDGSTKVYEPGTIATDIVRLGEKITLYAQWIESNLRQYTVIHYQQTSDLKKYNQVFKQTYDGEKGGSVTPEVKNYDGFLSPEPQTVTVADDDSTVVNYYYDRITYSVKFDGNGATSGQMKEAEVFVYNIRKTLTPNTYQKKGSIFNGWNTARDGSGTAYTDQQSVLNLADENGKVITLYAQWLDNEHELTPQNGVVYVTVKAGQTVVIPDLPAGTTYTIEEVNVPDGWKETGKVNEDGSIEANVTATASVTNTYTAKGSAYLEAHKALPEDTLTAGRFTFELLDSSRNVLQTRSNDEPDTSEKVFDEEGNSVDNPWKGTAPVIFDEITYTEKDIGHTYTYYIREVAKDGDNVAYDTHEERVSVTVTDSGKGILSTNVVYDSDGALFTNHMETASLKVSKTTVGSPDPDSEFTFVLELKDPDGNSLEGTYPAKKYQKDHSSQEETKYSHTPNISDDGTKNGSYSNSYARTEVVTVEGAKQLHVKITWGGESPSYDWACMWAGAHPDYTAYSNHSASLTGKLGGGSYTSASNTREYTVDGDTVTFAFRSDGSGTGDGYGYYAVVTGVVETGVEPLSLSSGDRFTLKDGEFLIAEGLPHGTSYTVTEQEKTDWQLTAAEGTAGTLQAGAQSEASFTNTYHEEPKELKTEVTLQLTKKVVGGVIEEDDDFTFLLRDLNGNVLQTAEVSETGNDTATVVFEPLVYHETDSGRIFTYLLQERKGDDRNVQYDTRLFRATVSVDQVGEELTAEVHYYQLNGDSEEEDIEVDEIVITNTKMGSFRLQKIDKDSGEALAGAKFTLRNKETGEYVQNDGSLAEEVHEFVTLSNGTFGIEKVPVGTYILHESEAPKGYKTAEDIECRIEDGQLLVEEVPLDIITVEDEKYLTSLTLTKTLTRYESSSPVTFVFSVKGVQEGKEIYNDVVSLTFSKEGVESLTLEELPIGDYTVEEIYSGASYKIEGEKEKKITLTPEGDNNVSFSNSYNDKPKKSYGADNRFTNTDGKWSWVSDQKE